MRSKGNVMDHEPWLTSEPGVGAALRQVIGLCLAGLRRPWLTFGLAVGLVGAGAGVSALMKRDYAPHFVVRVVEANREQSNVPPLKRQLAEYVRQAALTSDPLYAIMRRHGLYPTLMRKNARAALEAFKEDISVEVYQNYFVEDRAPRDLPRSARLTVSFHAKDPNLALAVTRDLGALIVQHEQAMRREQALSLATGAEHARDRLLTAVQERTAAVLNKRDEIERSRHPDPRLQVELVGLLGSLEALEKQADTAERRAAKLDLTAALERRGIGLHFEVVDDGTLPGRAGRLSAALLTVGVSFLSCLPLIAVAVGAFTPVKRGAT
jgi:hypothetical protein